MAAPKGNINAMKFSTPSERQIVALDYARHCEQGLSDEAFYIDTETLERYIRDFPIDFGTVKAARQRRRLFWERVGIEGMTGKIQGYNAITWIFNMKNRFGWQDQRDKKPPNGYKFASLTALVQELSQK